MKNLQICILIVIVLILIAPFSLLAGSFDGDMYPDLIITTDTGSAGEVQWWENVGGSVQMRRIVNYGGNRWQTCAIGDLDGDSNPDLLLGSNNQLDWYEASGDNSVTRIDSFSIGSTYDLQFYNNDVYIAREGGISKLTSGGNNIARTSSIVSHSATYMSVLPTDFDSDGNIELFAGWQTNPTATTGQVDLYEDTGTVSKISSFIYAAGGSEFASGDYDGDSSEDVFISWGYGAGSSIAWYETDGTDNGLVRNQRLQYMRAEELELADLDEDGKMDLVISNNGNGESTDVYEVTGDGTWLRTMRPNQYRASGALSSGDWDLDGDVDLIYGSFDDTATFGLYWGEASGDNTWQGNGYLSQYMYTASDSVLYVPEPASVVLLLTGTIGLLAKRKK